MDVTAIIPTLGDRPAMLSEAIDSVYGQTIEVDRLIVVVDGDDEALIRVAKSIQGRPNLEVITAGEGRQGVSVARNVGASRARTAYLAFLDDDDVWRSGHLAAFSEDVVDIGLSAFWKHRGNECIHEKTPPAVLHPRRFLVTNGGCRGSNLVVRSEFFWSIGGFDPKLRAFNDVDFAIRASLMSNVRYRRNRNRDVVFRAHRGDRISKQGSKAYRRSAQDFEERHGARMTRVDRERFRLWIATVENFSMDETRRWEELHS